jgi:pimeloyl-ACP methyl ester carboxylesterase
MQRSFLIWPPLAALPLLVALFILVETAQAATLEPAACPFFTPDGWTRGDDLICGWLAVPADHDNPDNGATVRLRIAVFYTRASVPAPPLIYLHGGPGGNAVENLLSGAALDRLTRHRDLILLDQRGGGLSIPALTCPEIETYNQITPDDDAYMDGYIQAALTCSQRLQAAGHDLSQYTSRQRAYDIDFIRQALGYERVSLYGISYGARVALTAARQLDPARLDRIILDGVYDPAHPTYTQPLTLADALDALAGACADDPACNATYGPVDALLADQLMTLADDPLLLATGETVDDALLLDALTFALAAGRADEIPYALSRLAAGQSSWLRADAPKLRTTYLESIAWGAYYSTQCHEALRAMPFEDRQAITDAIPPALQGYAHRQPESSPHLHRLCASWGVPIAGPAATAPVTYAGPVLLLSGRLDPFTGPADAERTAATLPASTHVVFQAGGHGVGLRSACGLQMVTDFLRGDAVNPACAAAPVAFLIVE